MKKGVKKQMAAVALSLLTVSGIGLSGANVVKAASPLKNKATINITAKKVRKAVTKTSSCSINLSRVPRPYFNMGVGECVLTDTLTFPLIPNILFYCVQTVFTNR